MQPLAQIIFRPRFLVEQVADVRRYEGPRRAALEALVTRWCGTLGIAEPEYTADPEDWAENAVQLDAALASGSPVYVTDRRDPGAFVARFNTDREWNAMTATVLLGAAPRTEILEAAILCPDPRSYRQAVGYASLAAFTRYAGRDLQLADIPDGEMVPRNAPTAVAQVLASRAANGATSAMVKIVARAKRAPVQRIRLFPWMDARHCAGAVLDAFGYALLDVEGMRNAVLVQSDVLMLDEYRVFVIDGHPVTGAGCIECLTPMDALPTSADMSKIEPNFDTSAQHVDSGNTSADGWDLRVEGVRRSGAIRSDAELIAEYRRAAGEITTDIRTEASDLLDYTLDLATVEGQTVVVEINPMANAGLFACDVGRLVAAAVAAAERRGEHDQTGISRAPECLG